LLTLNGILAAITSKELRIDTFLTA